jgi:hypothetical protein
MEVFAYWHQREAVPNPATHQGQEEVGDWYARVLASTVQPVVPREDFLDTWAESLAT